MEDILFENGQHHQAIVFTPLFSAQLVSVFYNNSTRQVSLRHAQCCILVCSLIHFSAEALLNIDKVGFECL